MIELHTTEMAKALIKAEKAIREIPTEKLRGTLPNLKRWSVETTDRLEKMVWSDLLKLTQQELKKRAALSNKSCAEETQP